MHFCEKFCHECYDDRSRYEAPYQKNRYEAPYRKLPSAFYDPLLNRCRCFPYSRCNCHMVYQHVKYSSYQENRHPFMHQSNVMSRIVNMKKDELEEIEFFTSFELEKTSKKKKRSCFTKRQLAELEEYFLHQQYVTMEERIKLSEKLNLNESQIKIWFQNRRAKTKREICGNKSYAAEYKS